MAPFNQACVVSAFQNVGLLGCSRKEINNVVRTADRPDLYAKGAEVLHRLSKQFPVVTVWRRVNTLHLTGRSRRIEASNGVRDGPTRNDHGHG